MSFKLSKKVYSIKAGKQGVARYPTSCFDAWRASRPICRRGENSRARGAWRCIRRRHFALNCLTLRRCALWRAISRLMSPRSLDPGCRRSMAEAFGPGNCRHVFDAAFRMAAVINPDVEACHGIGTVNGIGPGLADRHDVGRVAVIPAPLVWQRPRYGSLRGIDGRGTPEQSSQTRPTTSRSTVTRAASVQSITVRSQWPRAR